MNPITNRVVIEYNDKGYLMYSENYPGAYTRGKEHEEALLKFPQEIKRYWKWAGIEHSETDGVASVLFNHSIVNYKYMKLIRILYFCQSSTPFQKKNTKY